MPIKELNQIARSLGLMAQKVKRVKLFRCGICCNGNEYMENEALYTYEELKKHKHKLKDYWATPFTKVARD